MTGNLPVTDLHLTGIQLEFDWNLTFMKRMAPVWQMTQCVRLFNRNCVLENQNHFGTIGSTVADV